MLSSFVLALALLQPHSAEARKPAPPQEGFWLTSPDRGYSIQFPYGWPYPGKSQSVSPPKMKHLFFLTTADDGLAVDVAAATADMPAETYFDLVRSMRAEGATHDPIETKRLKDGSSFRFFRSVEPQGRVKQRFLQGILKKKDATYYVTVTSPKRHPTPKEWPLILAALASLRTGGSTVGGGSVPVLKPGTEVVDISAAGSALRIAAPYELSPWGYTRRFGTPLHSFKRGAIRCEVALLGQAKAGPKELATGLRAKYYESAGRPSKGESPVKSRKLKDGSEVFFYQIGLPARDDDPRKQWMLEGFFARKGQTYYYLAAAARDEVEQARFERESAESLDLLGAIEWPR